MPTVIPFNTYFYLTYPVCLFVTYSAFTVYLNFDQLREMIPGVCWFVAVFKMAFATRVQNLLKKAVASNPSVYQAVRCMSSSKLFIGGSAHFLIFFITSHYLMT